MQREPGAEVAAPGLAPGDAPGPPGRAALVAATPLTVAVLMLPVGLAGPLIMPPVTALLLNSVPDAIAGTASGVALPWVS